MDDWGVQVFGREVDESGKPRSASTSVNRIEFPDPNSTLRPSSSRAVVAPPLIPTMAQPWDEGVYTGYKLNCHKKKRKVMNLIELYDKDSVSSVQDKDIYKVKLSEIGTAALEASEYITDLIAQLEVNNEEARVNELLAIKNEVVQAVKKNEKDTFKYVKIRSEGILI